MIIIIWRLGEWGQKNPRILGLVQFLADTKLPVGCSLWNKDGVETDSIFLWDLVKQDKKEVKLLLLIILKRLTAVSIFFLNNFMQNCHSRDMFRTAIGQMDSTEKGSSLRHLPNSKCILFAFFCMISFALFQKRLHNSSHTLSFLCEWVSRIY